MDVFFSGNGYWTKVVTVMFWLHQVIIVIITKCKLGKSFPSPVCSLILRFSGILKSNFRLTCGCPLGKHLVSFAPQA